jgi:Flp pilus assembly protein TadB
MNTRNKPCACGSGKKSKVCCKSPAALSRKRQQENEELARRIKERAEQRQKEVETIRKKYPGQTMSLPRAVMLAAATLAIPTMRSRP